MQGIIKPKGFIVSGVSHDVFFLGLDGCTGREVHKRTRRISAHGRGVRSDQLASVVEDRLTMSTPKVYQPVVALRQTQSIHTLVEGQEGQKDRYSPWRHIPRRNPPKRGSQNRPSFVLSKDSLEVNSKE